MPAWFDLPHGVGPIAVVWVVHLAMALSLLELVARLWAGWRQRRLQATWGEALHLGAGLCLMLALREALTTNRPLWVLACLSAAGAAHLGELWWRRR